jgi:hypothetical protein
MEVEEVKVIDRTTACLAGQPTLPLRYSDLTCLVVHKTSVAAREDPWNLDPVPDGACTAVELARRFRRPNHYTGGRVPYHFLIDRFGAVEQMVPLGARGTHAKGYNYASVAVAYLGEQPTPEQLAALVAICSLLVPLNSGLDLVGHTQLPGASADPHKVCPSPHLDLAWLRQAAETAAPSGWRLLNRPHVEELLVGAGVVL